MTPSPDSTPGTKSVLRILHLEDSEFDAELVRSKLEQESIACNIDRVQTRKEFLGALKHGEYDIIISDYTLPMLNGREALSLAISIKPEVPFLFLSGTMGEEAVVQSLLDGATDYVLKVGLSRLVPAIRRALAESKLRAERRQSDAALRSSREELRALAAHLQSIREDERTTIAREIHDELGQALTGMKMDAVWLKKQLASHPGAIESKIAGMIELIDATIQSVRRIASELRPGVLDNLGLIEAIEWQAQEFAQRTGIACTVRSDVESLSLDKSHSTGLFRIFQETLTNVVRHAEASRVEVRISAKKKLITMSITDNGKGIKPGEISNSKSLGLLGMRERVLLFGGTMEITGAPGKGTTVLVHMPMTTPRLSTGRARVASHRENSNITKRKPRR